VGLLGGVGRSSSLNILGIMSESTVEVLDVVSIGMTRNVDSG